MSIWLNLLLLKDKWADDTGMKEFFLEVIRNVQNLLMLEFLTSINIGNKLGEYQLWIFDELSSL